MCEKKVVEKIKTHILRPILFFFENPAVCRCCGETYCAFSVTKATDTDSLSVIITAFHRKNDYANIPYCYIVGTVNCLSCVSCVLFR